MKAEWMDDDQSKVALHLEDGETFGDFAGPGSFQLVANDLNADFARLEAMEDVKIEDAPEPEGLSDAQKEARAARKKAAEERRAEAKKRANEAKAAATKAEKAAAAKPAEHAAGATGHANTQHAAAPKK